MSTLAAWEGTATGLLHDLVDAAPRAKLIVRDQYRRVLTAWVAHRLLIRRLNEVRNNLTKPPPARMDNAAAQTRGSP